MTQLALVIDLNVCVGCHACVTSCKEWNTSGAAGPLYLSRSIAYQGRSYQMVGAIPGDVKMHDKPVGRGYVHLKEDEAHPWPRPGSNSLPNPLPLLPAPLRGGGVGGEGQT